MVDSGASYNLITKDCVRRLGVVTRSKDLPYPLVDTTDEVIDIVEEEIVPLLIVI
jgi:hypothetical protein